MIWLPVQLHYSDKVSIRRAVLLAQKRVKFVRADHPLLLRTLRLGLQCWHCTDWGVKAFRFHPW